MSASITAFDAIVLAVLLLSGLLALVRGFVREALSVAAFVAAALGALWMLPVLRPPVRGMIQPDWAADAAALVATFLLIYLAVTLVTSSISKQLRGGDEPGLVDRVGGLAFGVVRGVVLLALFVIAWTAMAPPDYQARWMTEARLYPLIASTATALQELAPESSRIAMTPPPPETITATPRAARPAPATGTAPAPAEDTGYGERTRQGLDQLIGRAAEREERDSQ